MPQSDLIHRLYLLRGIIIEQRRAYSDSIWWRWAWNRKPRERYDSLVDALDALIRAVRSSDEKGVGL